jgi:hypothetical protein
MKLKTVVDSQVNRVVQPIGPDPDGLALADLKYEAAELAYELQKPVVLLMHNGARHEFRPNKP